MKHNKVEPKFAVCINNEDYIVSTISPSNEELEGSPISSYYLSFIFHIPFQPELEGLFERISHLFAITDPIPNPYSW